MPIYEYQCNICGKTFEFLQLNNSEIPSCCGQVVAKIPSVASGFRFPKDVSYAKDCCKRDREVCYERDCRMNKVGI